MSYQLPALPYPEDALEPHIDARTMNIHRTKHHAAYTNNLNAALDKYPDLYQKSLEALLADLDNLPDDIRMTVRNNGGGYANHALFWETMSPQGGGQPSGALAEAIEAKFGSFSEFQRVFSNAAATRFGSGWAWLFVNGAGELSVGSTPNQDTPLMDGHTPLLGLDVWEHAYYLNYQNRRPDYVTAFWNVVNWDVVGEKYATATA